MRLGKLFKAIVKLPLIPAAIVADIASLGVNRFADPRTGGRGKFLTEKAVDSVADDLDEVTD